MTNLNESNYHNKTGHKSKRGRLNPPSTELDPMASAKEGAFEAISSSSCSCSEAIPVLIETEHQALHEETVGCWHSLPSEVYLLIVSYQAATPADLARIQMVSKSFRNLVRNNPSLWKGVAEHRYGKALAKHTAPLYHHNYEQMLRTDNRRGALLVSIKTLEDPWLDSYEAFYNGQFLCEYKCTIDGLAFDRSNHLLYLYLDIEGDHQHLQDPAQSRVAWHPGFCPCYDDGDVDGDDYLQEIFVTPGTEIYGSDELMRPAQEYFETPGSRPPGKRKGVARYSTLRFREQLRQEQPTPMDEMGTQTAGTWFFLFRMGQEPHTCRIPLFDLGEGESMESAIRKLPGFRYGRKPNIH